MRENPPYAARNRTDGYQKAVNAEATTMVMMAMILSKEMGCRWDTPTAQQRDQALAGSQLTSPQILMPKN